jgi:hypothetical protein
MTSIRRTNKDKKVGTKDEQKNRQKTSDRYGNRYDKRKGEWTARDRADREFTERVMEPPSVERSDAELSVLNYPGKPGPKFIYAPCVIFYIQRIKEALGCVYRRAVGIAKGILSRSGLPTPTYSEFYKALRLCHMNTARSMAASAPWDFEDGMFEPMATDTGVHVPHDIIDAENMTVIVFPDDTGGERKKAAVDGSGETLECTGAYKSRKWNVCNARFLHQHLLMDVTSKGLRPIAYIIASDKVGDSKVMGILVREAVKAGHNITTLYADAAYESIANWEVTEELGIEFVVNMPEGRRTNMTSFVRNEAIRIRNTLGAEVWRIFSGYGRRWLVEVFFSVFKKVFGDKIRARIFIMQKIGMMERYELYDMRARIIEKEIGRVRS